MTHSVLDQWVTPDVRDNRTVGVRTADFMAIRREASTPLPSGQRETHLRRVAERWNVSLRTVHRYIRHPVCEVAVAGWYAMYELPADAPPSRVTAWSREPMQTEREETTR